MAAIILIVCMEVSGVVTCERIPIQVEGLTMQMCKTTVAGQLIARTHWRTLYSDRQFGGWECVPVSAPEKTA